MNIGKKKNYEKLIIRLIEEKEESKKLYDQLIEKYERLGNDLYHEKELLEIAENKIARDKQKIEAYNEIASFIEDNNYGNFEVLVKRVKDCIYKQRKRSATQEN